MSKVPRLNPTTGTCTFITLLSGGACTTAISMPACLCCCGFSSTDNNAIFYVLNGAPRISDFLAGQSLLSSTALLQEPLQYTALGIVKGKGFPYSLPSIGPGADPSVQAVSPQVTISHPPSSRLPLLSTRPAVTFPATQHHRPLAGKSYTAW